MSDELTAELERSPSISEIADRLEVSEEEVLEAMEMGQSYNALSVDHSIEADKDGSTVTLLDIMGQQDDHYDLTEKRMILEKILPILSDREREIIQCTFIEGLSQKETGERIGLSQMHVSRLQRTAIRNYKKQHINRICLLMIRFIMKNPYNYPLIIKLKSRGIFNLIKIFELIHY